MKSLRHLALGTLALGAIALFTAPAANANSLIPSLTNKTQSGSLFTYFYTVKLDGAGGSSQIFTGNQFTLIDFLGYQTGSATVLSSAAGTWSKAEAGAFVTTLPLGASNDPTKLDVQFTYTGPNQVSVVDPLFTFSVQSTFGTTSVAANTVYSATDSDTETPSNPQANQGRVRGAAVPEASTVLLFSGIAGTGLAALRRRKK